jgi:3-oxoacyl-[acyl-carrier protein] reductase
LSEGLLQAGYRVASFSRKRTDATADLEARWPGAWWFTEADVGEPAQLDRLVQRVEAEVGPLWGLVNNAGLAREGVLAVMPEDQIAEVIQVNLLGALALTRRVSRRLLARRAGRIVNISSIIGLRGYAGLAAYSASKAGLDGMTRALARELGPRQITVNSIAPGYLETEMTHGLGPDQRGQIVRRTPVGRLGRPEDVVGPLLFLLSDAAAFVTGQTLAVDGGITC